MTIQLNLKSEARLEVAFARVIEGMEAQVFGEYFPAVGPIVADHGGQPLGSFGINATNVEDAAPKFGALFNWPSTEVFNKFHDDPRFTKIKHLRDDALDIFSNGHFFRAAEETINLVAEKDYALILAKENPLDSVPLLDLPLAKDSPKQTYSGKSVTLHDWSDAAALLLADSRSAFEVYQIRFNPPKP